MDYVIITGASRGLGEALVRELMQPDKSLFCVARTVNEEIIEESRRRRVELHWIQADLAAPDALQFMDQIAERVEPSQARSLTLINNAAVAGPMGPLGSATAEEIARSIAVNLTAPVILSHAFVGLFGSLECRKLVINVSSGAAQSPMPGLSTYSATKAGLNAFTRAAGEEDASGVRFVAVSPGIVDTAMQAALRDAGPGLLPNHATYVGWKTGQQLLSPSEAARRLLTLLDREVVNGSYVHGRDL